MKKSKDELVILYVEDNKINQLVVKSLLEAADYKNVQLAEDAESAIKFLENPANHCDLILMDIGLPGMGGVALTEKIRASDWKAKDVPIIALTGNGEATSKSKCLAAGMNYFLEKPVDKTILELTLEKLLM